MRRTRAGSTRGFGPGCGNGPCRCPRETYSAGTAGCTCISSAVVMHARGSAPRGARLDCCAIPGARVLLNGSLG